MFEGNHHELLRFLAAGPHDASELRQDFGAAGELINPRDLWDATRAAGDNFFVVKVSYWLGVN